MTEGGDHTCWPDLQAGGDCGTCGRPVAGRPAQWDVRLANLARAYEEQRRPGGSHLMTAELAEAIEALLDPAPSATSTISVD